MKIESNVAIKSKVNYQLTASFMPYTSLKVKFVILEKHRVGLKRKPRLFGFSFLLCEIKKSSHTGEAKILAFNVVVLMNRTVLSFRIPLITLSSV